MSENRTRTRLWIVLAVSAAALILVFVIALRPRGSVTAETGDPTVPVVTMMETSPQPGPEPWAIRESWPVTDLVVLKTAKEPQRLVGLPVEAHGFTVQQVVAADRFTAGPSPEHSVLVTLPDRDPNGLPLRQGQTVSLQGQVRQSSSGPGLFVAAEAVQIHGSGAA